MKWLSILLLALIASIVGIMLTDGLFKYVAQISFFAVLILCFFTLSVDYTRS